MFLASKGVLKDPSLFIVLPGIWGIFLEKKTPPFIVDKTKSLLTLLDGPFPHKDIEYNEHLDSCTIKIQ